MTRRAWLRIGAGAVTIPTGAFLAVIAGDALASAAFPEWDLSLPPAGDFNWAASLYLLGVVATAVAVVVTFRKTREALWGWIAGTVAAVLFLVPLALLPAGGRADGRIVYGVWAVAFVEIAVAWSAALAGRWAFLRFAPGEDEEPRAPPGSDGDRA